MSKTYTVAELAEATGLNPRTLRHYTSKGFLTKPPFRGRMTRYTEDHVIQVLAMRALLRQKLSTRAAKAAIQKMTPEELRAKAGLPPLDVDPPPQPPLPPPPVPPPPQTVGDAWSRLALLPGLELHVRADATEFVRRVAQEIGEKYAAR